MNGRVYAFKPLDNVHFFFLLFASKEKRAKEYLTNNYPHNEKIVYRDSDYLFINGVKYDDTIVLGDYYEVIAKSENHLLCYFDATAYNKFYQKNETRLKFYKCGYESYNLLLVRQITLRNILYHQKAIVIYTSDDGTLLKYNAIEDAEIEYLGEIPSVTSRYSWREEGVTFADTKLFITDLISRKE